MGFFSDLKEDLSQAVNELMPEEDQNKTNDEQELTEAAVEAAETTEAEMTESGDTSFSLEEMLQHVDSIKLDDTDLQMPEEAKAAEKEVLQMPEEAKAAEKEVLQMPEEAKAAEEEVLQMPEEAKAAEEEVLQIPEEAKAAEEEVLQIPEDVLSTESDTAENADVPDMAEPEIGGAETDEVKMNENEADQAEIMNDEDSQYNDSQYEENKEVEETMDTMEAMETMETTETMDTMEATDTMDMMAGNREAADETAVITAAMLIKGDITTEGSVDVIGTVNGNIDAFGKLNITGCINGNSKAAEIYAEGAKINGEIVSEGAVKIGASSVIIGNITATSAAIAGAVKGDIDVQGPVILDTSAIVMGNIKSKSVQINNGAVIEGMCSQCYADVSPTSFFDEYKPEPVRKSKSK